MEKRMLVIAAPLLFLIITTTSNAEMRITPQQITTSDDSASLRLSKSVHSVLPYHSHGVINGVNLYTGQYYSCGVYGKASDDDGWGVFGRAEGTHGRGVYGYASGTLGRGVYGTASAPEAWGVYGTATGALGKGVCGFASGTNGRGVYAYGGKWDFYAAGPGGNYGPFTGAHEVKFTEDMPGEIVPGMIVSVTGRTEKRKDKNGEISLSSTLPTVILSTKARDKAVFGVIVSDGPLPQDHWYESQEGERFGVVNALGEGRVWVTDINGDIQAGDYITTSSVPGYGQMQDDDILHSYTLGKAIETIDWDQVTETVQHDGKTYRRYLIAVVYTSG